MAICSGVSHSIIWSDTQNEPIDFWTAVRDFSSTSASSFLSTSTEISNTGEIRVQIEKVLNKSERESVNLEIEQRIKTICAQPIQLLLPQKDIHLSDSVEMNCSVSEKTVSGDTRNDVGGYDIEVIDNGLSAHDILPLTDESSSSLRNSIDKLDSREVLDVLPRAHHTHLEGNLAENKDLNHSSHVKSTNSKDANLKKPTNSNNSHNLNSSDKINVSNNPEQIRTEVPIQIKKQKHKKLPHSKNRYPKESLAYDLEVQETSSDLGYDPYLVDEKRKKYACHDDLENYNYYESPEEPNKNAIPPPEMKKNHSLNERFQLATQSIRQFRASITSANEKIQANMDLIRLYQDFIYSARLYGKIIISERYLPTKLKTIKPSLIGGMAGGDKFIKSNCFFLTTLNS